MKYLETLTWHLEMKERPSKPAPAFPGGFSISTGSRPELREYLSIYRAVGDKYNWYDRLLMPQDVLQEKLNSRHTLIIYLLYQQDIAGFAELDLSVPGDAEIVYFGICDAYTGKKAGMPFLKQVIDLAWEYATHRVWLHTCDLDHPAALPLYQKAGFIVYKTEKVLQPVPKTNLK